MNESTTYYNNLITRYFSGEIQEDELRSLSAWIKANPQNEESFIQYQKTWQLIENHNIQSKIDTDREWKALQQKMGAIVPATENTAKVIPLNQNKNKNTFSLQKTWKVAAAVIILFVSTFLIYQYMAKPENIVVTAQGQNMEQTLPDGSVVSLKAGSQITYPASFASNNRRVELTGEAYFRVSHDKTKPFIVASGNARIEVLGTQFNVHPNSVPGSTEVVLTSGKVSVYFEKNPRENIILAPGEKALISTGNSTITKSANTDINYMAWKTHKLVFENQSLPEVVNTLRNVYQKEISLTDTGLSQCKVTATFENQSLESVLQVIGQTLELKMKQVGDRYEISGKGCIN